MIIAWPFWPVKGTPKILSLRSHLIALCTLLIALSPFAFV
jgi:hypothetical protein